MQQKTAFFVIATRGRISMMLRQDLFQRFLESGWRVVIFSPFSGETAFLKEFQKSGVYFESLENITVWARRVAYVRGSAMQQRHPVLREARRIHCFMTRGFRKHTFGSNLKKFLINVLAFLVPTPLKRSDAFWEFLMRKALSPSSVEKSILHYKPSVIVVASAGAEGNDVPFIVFGNKHHVPTLAIDSNSDAATYRYFSAPWRVSHWALFSELQKQEFYELHHVPDDRLTVTGALRYDHYFRNFKPLPREEFLRKIGVNPQKKIIFLGAKTPIVFPHNEDIVSTVLEAIRKGKFGNSELYVRFDPGHDLLRYSKEFLSTFKWERAEDVPQGEHIANLLAHSAVYLGLGATTLAIEACAVGTPSLWIGFDGNTTYRDKNDSCRLQYDLPVFSRIIKSGAIPLVESKEELLATIQKFLENPGMNKTERQRMLQQEYANADDGKAAERIFVLVKKLADSSTMAR